MSRDFSPRECWYKNKETISDTIPHGIYLQNYSWVIDGKEHPAFTDAELQDRRVHPYLAVTGGDIYKTVREILPEEKFEKLNRLIGELIDADFGGKSTDGFPKEVTDWYFNRHNHHYHEPNDATFLEYLRRKWQ